MVTLSQLKSGSSLTTIAYSWKRLSAKKHVYLSEIDDCRRCSSSSNMLRSMPALRMGRSEPDLTEESDRSRKLAFADRTVERLTTTRVGRISDAGVIRGSMIRLKRRCVAFRH
jgi:hypothetical protein